VTHFDALAPDYDRLRPAGDGWHELAEHTLAALAGATRLLDIGCGTGRFAVLAAERLGARVWGVDASDEMLAEATARPGASRVGWRRAEAGRLPFRDGWFDAAHAHLVLHLVDDLGAAIAEMARVLVPGGRVAVGTFAPEHFREFFLNPYFPSIPAIDLARFPDPDRLCADLRRAGFEGAAVQPIDQDVTAGATDVLERVRGRYISTLRLLQPEEYEAGLTRLEADVAGGVERFSYTLRWALVTAIAGSGTQLRA
jgi:SAM-dependent methyltransferase